MTLIISLQFKSEDLPIMDRIVCVSGICACGPGISDGRGRQSRHFSTSMFLLLGTINCHCWLAG